MLPVIPICIAAAGFLGAEPGGIVRSTRIYDVSYLTREVPSLPAPDWPPEVKLFLETEQEAASTSTGSLGFSAGSAEESGPGSIPGGLRIDPDALVQMLRKNLAEDSWANDRNSIEVRGEDLVVRQTAEVHEAIGRFLAVLRARRAAMFLVEFALVPAAEAPAPPADGGPWWPEAVLDEALARAGPKGSRFALLACNGGTVAASSGSLRTAAADIDVDQTGVIPVRRTVLERLRPGTMVEVEPRAVTGTDRVRLRIRVVRLSPAGEARTIATPAGEVEAVPTRREEVDTALFLAPGRTALAGLLAGGPDAAGPTTDLAVLVRARRADLAAVAAAEASAEEFQARLYDPGLAWMDREGDPDSIAGEVEATIRTNVDPGAWRDERAAIEITEGLLLRVVARAATHRAVEEWVDRFRRERGAIVRIDVQVREGPADAVRRVLAVPSAPELPAGWEETPEGKALAVTGRAVLLGLPGREIRSSGIESRPYVRQIETVSGGTGFSVAYESEPWIGSAPSGLEIEATAGRLLDQERLRLDLTVRAARAVLGETAEAAVPVLRGPRRLEPIALPPEDPRKDRAGSAIVASILSKARETWPLELPRQDRVFSAASTTMSPGRPSAIEAVPGSAGRMVLIVATAWIGPAFEERR